MQHTRPPNYPLHFPSFKGHRSDLEQSGFASNLTLPEPTAVPIWASLPSPPMSGSPSSDPPSDPPQIAGRRRKRSETPPTTTAPTAASLPTPFEQSARAAFGQVGVGQSGGDGSAQPILYSASYPPPPSTYAGPMGAIAATPPDTLFAPGQISPKAVRKTKAHVASACVNCKKKHLRCDNARPCRRCVQSGKEDSCRDVEHKKRGRPPLRPDEPSSRRSFDPNSSMLQGQASDPSRRMPSSDPALYAQPAAYSRSFRPLQAQPQFDPSRTQIRSNQYQMYAPPSVQPSQATAMGSFVPSGRQYGQQQPSPYMMSPSDAPRGAYQGGYSYPSPQEQMAMAPPQFYSNPIFPRSQMPAQQFDPGMGMMGHPSLQLPPIRPAPERSPIDPALVQGGTASQEQSPQEEASGAGTSRRPDPKRPRMDIQGILGPKHE